ncbi:MAG: flagellar basal-body rod protein FlgF [Gammaproteobacteria bacterium]
MDRMLYVAMSGAKQMMLAQAVNTNNLANAGTTGFREDLALFDSKPLAGQGLPTRVYAQAEHKGVNLASGSMVETGRDLDVAVQGKGWIAVQGTDGGEAYTRAGNLKITALGALVTADGLPVLGNSGVPIAIPPAEKVEIGRDGTITIRPPGQSPQALAVVDRIKLVNPDESQLYKDNVGLIRLRDGGSAESAAGVTLEAGKLEMSNVNSVEAMVNMISLARQFEMSIKMMNIAKENDSASTQLMRIA